MLLHNYKKYYYFHLFEEREKRLVAEKIPNTGSLFIRTPRLFFYTKHICIKLGKSPTSRFITLVRNIDHKNFSARGQHICSMGR